MKPKQSAWWLIQWQDMKGNIKYWIALFLLSLAVSGAALLTRGLLWWQQFGLMVIFLALFAWAVIATIKAHNSAASVRKIPAVPKITIEVADIRQTFINRGARATWTEREHGFQAMVVSFRNHPASLGEQNTSFSNVSANLTYSGKDKKEHIVYGTWLDEYTHHVNFAPGEVRHLLIAWFERAGKRLMSFYNPNRINPLRGRFRPGITLHEPKSRVLPISPCEVTVTLLSNEHTLFHRSYTLTSTEDGTMELKQHD
jgi:hypothetical protein